MRLIVIAANLQWLVEIINMKLTPEIKAIKKGQWLFSCSMKPLQFDSWDVKNYKDYGIRDRWDTLSPEEKEEFLFNDFHTMEGSHHSLVNCSLSPISEEYALFFIANKCDQLFDSSVEGNYWDAYENAVRELCVLNNIKYEGI